MRPSLSAFAVLAFAAFAAAQAPSPAPPAAAPAAGGPDTVKSILEQGLEPPPGGYTSVSYTHLTLPTIYSV